MRHTFAALLILTLAGCTSSVPSDEELRLAAASEMSKQNKSEAEQSILKGGKVTDVHCEGPDTSTVCSFKVGDKTFKKNFARTGSGAWSSFEGAAN